jgi:hypothetical protein
MNEQIQQMNRDVAEIEAFKASIEREQVKFPLDSESLKVIHKDLMIPTGQIVYPVVPNPVPDDFSQEATVNGKKYLLHFTS